VGGGRRLSLTPQSLLIEARGAGASWIPARAIDYDEISAVYRYDSRDWGFLGVACAVWLGLSLVIVLAALFLRASPWEVLAVLAVAGVVVGAAAVYRIQRVPRKLLRVEAVGGSLVVADRSSGFFDLLAARLPKPEAGAPASPEPGPGDAPGVGEP